MIGQLQPQQQLEGAGRERERHIKRGGQAGVREGRRGEGQVSQTG
jgi:hypothetical protein